MQCCDHPAVPTSGFTRRPPARGEDVARGASRTRPGRARVGVKISARVIVRARQPVMRVGPRADRRRAPGRAPGGAWAPPLPAHRGPAEEPVVRAVQHRTLTAVGVDAKLEVQTLPVEHPEAVADPIVPSVLRGADADPRRPHEAASHRQPVADLALEAVA